MNISKEYFLFLVNMKYSDLVVLVTVCSIGVAYFILKLSWRRVSSSTSLRGDVPGRLGLPYIGETLSFMLAVYSTKGCYDFVRLRRIWFGKWFKTRLFGQVHVFVPSVEGAKIIYTNDFVKFNKGYMKSMADCMGKKSVFCVPHQDHTRIRHILSDFFSMDSLCSFVEKFDQMLCQRLEKLERSSKSFLLIDFSNELTFDALCCLLMSVTEESLLRKLQNYVTAISEGMLSFPVMIPGTKYYKGIKARRGLMETFQDMIDRRRNGKVSPEPQDFLQSMLRRDSYPQSEKLDDSEIMDGLLSLIIAGQSTTAAVMLWSVKYLDDNRKVQDKLRVEQLSIARSKPKEASLSFEDINNMSYCWKVVKETMRMANVVMWYPRVALSDSTIEGFEIKKGWNANIDATCIHYDPNLYAEPTKFNPSRFDDIQKPYSYIPFGAGPRTCLGINMGKMTMIVFLHRLTSGYRWTVDDPDNSLERKAHIPKLRNGCPITLMAL